MNPFLLFVTALLPLQEPFPPVGLEQRDEPFSPPSPAGFVDDDSRVALGASFEDGPVLFGLRLEVEVKPDGSPFDGTGLFEARPGAGTAFVVVTGLAPGFYHWRARTVDAAGRPSDWVEFHPPPDPDFGIALGPRPVPPAPPGDPGPALPEQLAQAGRPGGIAAPAGMADPDGLVAFRALVSHTSGAGNLVQIEVEVKPEGVAFGGTSSAVGHPVAGSGGLSEAVVAGLAKGAYRWRARALDHAGRRSAWVEFDTNPAADFIVGAAPMPVPSPSPPDSDGEGTCGALGIEAWVVLALLRRRRRTGRTPSRTGRGTSEP